MEVSTQGRKDKANFSIFVTLFFHRYLWWNRGEFVALWEAGLACDA
jgi:hypothetical protein